MSSRFNPDAPFRKLKLRPTLSECKQADAEWAKIAQEAASTGKSTASLVSQYLGEKGYSWEARSLLKSWLSGTSGQALQIQGALGALGIKGGLPLRRAGGESEESEYSRWMQSMDRASFEEGAENEEFRRFARDFYLITQAQLRADRIRSVRLYRGLRLKSRPEGDTIKIPARTMSSWTDSPKMAMIFATQHDTDIGDYPVVVERDIPAAAFLTTPKTLAPVRQEGEYIVLSAQSVPVKLWKPD